MHIREIKQQLLNGAQRVVWDNKIAFPTYKNKKLVGADIFEEKPGELKMWKRVTFS
jgi:hypothetical protein